MKARVRKILAVTKVLSLLELLVLPVAARAQFTFTTNNDQITVTAYTGSAGAVIIPSTTNGYPVTAIGGKAFFSHLSVTSVSIPDSVTSLGTNAFQFCENLTNVTLGGGITNIGAWAFSFCPYLPSVVIPASVATIGSYAFQDCFRLTGIFIQGNPPTPTNDLTVFSGDNSGTVYYEPRITGWGALFDGWPTAPWILPSPPIVVGGALVGGQAGGFGFTISWAVTNIALVVEATTNLAKPAWVPVSTNILTGGSFQFKDPQWTNYPTRFYRVSAP